MKLLGIGLIVSGSFAAAVILLIVTGWLLVGCSSAPAPLWYRTDGRSVRSSPEALQRAEADQAACDAERVKTIATGLALTAYARQEAGEIVFRGCMMDRGYVQR